MTQTFDTAPQPIPRDRWNRPLVVPPDGGKPVAYTRCTTYVDCLEDKYNLQRWQLRQVAVGLADRPDLLLSVTAHRDDKKELNKIAEKAMEAARSSASATTGTAVHALCERVDRGQPLGIVPAEARRDVEAYQRATACLENVYIEQFSVFDGYKIGGTPDRVVRYGDKYYIADIKTGRDIGWGALKIAMQLSVYAMSTPYVAPGIREPYPFHVDPFHAIVIHLPAGEGHCTLHFVDIGTGWGAVDTASDVRTLRTKKDWYTPFNPTTPTLATALAITAEQLIAQASTVDELRRLWSNAWPADVAAMAVARAKELEQAS